MSTKRIILFLFFSICILAQPKYDIKEHYVKKEYRISMRDGVKLFTSVYIPKDDTKEYPILLMRTPYSVGPYGEENYKRYIRYANQGFIFVFQDVRGRFMSEGKFVNMRPYIPDKSENEIDETTDTYDTIEWLINNIPNNNGNVGMWGISYPGFYAAMGCIDSHPALKVVSPQAPIADWFIGDDMHHNGALALSLDFMFFSVFGQVRDSLTTSWPSRFQNYFQDGYNFFLELGPLKNINEKYFKNKIPFWTEQSLHPDYDNFWKERSTLPHFNNVKPAVLVVGGNYDGEDLYGALNTYKSINEKNPYGYSKLVFGPWIHGGWARTKGDKYGILDFGQSTSDFFADSIELPFFNHFLKDSTEYPLPEAYVFETGINKWRKYDSWPPKNYIPTKLYLDEGFKVSFSKPSANTIYSYDEYVSDPWYPVPYTENFHDAARMYDRNYMNADQRFAHARPDVLTYESDELKDNLSVAGPVNVELYVSSSATDCDWVVKLIDVYPDSAKEIKGVEAGGYEMLIRGEIFRSRYRESFSHPIPLKPFEITKIKFSLNDIHHTFKKGHKLMIQIQSSWFPLFDRNPQNFVNIYQCDEKDFRKATQRVYHSMSYPTNIEIFVKEKGIQ